MEVVVPSPAMDFDFSGAGTSPYLSAPSSPKRFGELYLSAPTSPSRLSEFYREFDYFNGDSASSSIPIGWEEKPGTAKAATKNINDEDDGDDGFAFYVSQESEKSSRSAEELFDGGKIKPLKPPPRLEAEEFTSPKSPLLSPRQPRSPIAQGKKVIRDTFSPKRKKDSHDTFGRGTQKTQAETEQRRGRDRTPAVLSSSNPGRRATRSHSPYRISHYTWDEEQIPQSHTKEESSSSSSLNSRASLSSTSASSKSSRRWRLRDFLLFRSASEGRGSSKDPFTKVLYKKPEEVKNTSFRSSDSPASAAPASRRRVSAHEFHYAIKKAESEDLKKKTFLPYKQGILGRLAGLGSSTR